MQVEQAGVFGPEDVSALRRAAAASPAGWACAGGWNAWPSATTRNGSVRSSCPQAGSTGRPEIIEVDRPFAGTQTQEVLVRTQEKSRRQGESPAWLKSSGDMGRGGRPRLGEAACGG